MDQLNLERLAIPTVTVVTSQFTDLARAVALAEYGADACFAMVPHPIGMISQDEVRKKAREAFPEILAAATQWHQSRRPARDSRPAYPAERFKFTGTVEETYKHFFEKGWSLGLPIIPPTPGRLEAMLKGTERKPDEILGQAPPRMASLTVELVGVHAVMAGCRPEYMPLLIAALEALLAPEVNWRGALTTTETAQFVVIVNGPIVKEIGLAYGQGAAGKGHHANTTIGYALNLIAYTVGGSRPPSIDKSTLGSPADVVCWVFGENEDALPAGWEPLHVRRGFEKTASSVTVMCCLPPVNNMDHWSVTPEEHVRWWRYLVSPLLNIGGPCKPSNMELNPIIAVGPEHAQLIASAGWTPSDFRRAFWEEVRVPVSAWPSGCPEMARLIQKLGPINSQSMIPVAVQPEQIIIVLAGGAGKQSHYFAPFLGSAATSRLIMK